MARPAFCSLARVRRIAEAANSRPTGHRHLRRASMAGGRAISHVRCAASWDSGDALAFRVSGIECTYLRNLPRKTGSMVLQPRCGESSCRRNRAQLVSPTVLSRANALLGTRWLDRVCQRANPRWCCCGQTAGTLSSNRRAVSSLPGHARTFLDGTLLPVCAGWAGQPVSRRDSSSALAAATRRSKMGMQQHGGTIGNQARFAATITFRAEAGCFGVAAAKTGRKRCGRAYHLWNMKNAATTMNPKPTP